MRKVFVSLCVFTALMSGKASCETAPAKSTGTTTSSQSPPTQRKSDTLDVRGVDAKAFVENMDKSLTAAKKLIGFVRTKLSDEAKNSAKLALMQTIDPTLAKGSEMSDAEKKTLKDKRDELAATIRAIDEIKALIDAQSPADVETSINAALGEIKKIDIKSFKINIVSARYGDLKYEIGKISGLKRYCDVKDKALNDCQNKPFCTLNAATVCIDPVPQVESKTIRVVFQCIGPDMKVMPDNGSDKRTVESAQGVTNVLVVCTAPEGGF